MFLKEINFIQAQKNRLLRRLCRFCVVSGLAGVKKARIMRAG
nr:MAG TPA: hypothetical protein [Caudoviricetes sp.]